MLHISQLMVVGSISAFLIISVLVASLIAVGTFVVIDVNGKNNIKGTSTKKATDKKTNTKKNTKSKDKTLNKNKNKTKTSVAEKTSTKKTVATNTKTVATSTETVATSTETSKLSGTKDVSAEDFSKNSDSKYVYSFELKNGYDGDVNLFSWKTSDVNSAIEELQRDLHSARVVAYCKGPDLKEIIFKRKYGETVIDKHYSCASNESSDTITEKFESDANEWLNTLTKISESEKNINSDVTYSLDNTGSTQKVSNTVEEQKSTVDAKQNENSSSVKKVSNKKKNETKDKNQDDEEELAK